MKAKILLRNLNVFIVCWAVLASEMMPTPTSAASLSENEVKSSLDYLNSTSLDSLSNDDFITKYKYEPYAKSIAESKKTGLPTFDRAKVKKIVGFKDRFLDPNSGVCREGNYDSMIKSKEGKSLLAQCKKIKNFMAIRDQFEKCGLPTSVRDAYMKPILEGAASVDSASYLALVDCANRAGSIKKIFGQILPVTGAIERPLVEKASKRITEISVQNATRSYFTIAKTYPSNSPISDSQIVKSLCNGDCTPEMKKNILKDIAEMNKKLGPTPYKFTPEEAANVIDQDVQYLNALATSVKAPYDGSIATRISNMKISASALVNGETQSNYESYLEGYNAKLTDQLGLLLTSRPVMDQIGGPRVMDTTRWFGSNGFEKASERDPKTGELRTIMHLTPHNSMPPAKAQLLKRRIAVLEGTRELLNNISNQTEKLHEINKRRLDKNTSAYDLGKDLQRLVRTNPIAVGQFLMESPEYAELFCYYIKRIKDSDETDQAYREMFVAGGVLITLTGVGAGVGGGILTAAVMSGAGTAIGAVGTGATVYNYMQVQNKMESFQAGNNVKDTVIQREHAFDEMGSALENSTMELLTTVAAGGATKALKFAKAGSQNTKYISLFAKEFGPDKMKPARFQFMKLYLGKVKGKMKGTMEDAWAKLMKTAGDEDPVTLKKFLDKIDKEKPSQSELDGLASDILSCH